MRAILSKAVAVSMIAGAGLLVTACGGSTPAEVNNTTVVEDNMSDEMVGAMNDTVENVTVDNMTDANAM